MPKEIPVPDAPFSSIFIDLSEFSYEIVFYWNEQNKFWTMSIYKIDNTSVVEGFVLAINSCISSSWGYKIQEENDSFGAIYCISTIESNKPLNRYSFGKTALLVYYTAEEIEAERLVND